MALRWFSWVENLGGTSGHNLFLLPATGMDASEVVKAAEMAFPGAVTVLKDAEAITSDWQGTDLARSASGPNSSMRQLAWHFELNSLGPWLFVEMDCIPLKTGWITALELEYHSSGKPFMGARVLIPSVPEHMTGNAIYPQDSVSKAPTLVMRTNWKADGREFELAFDVASAAEVLPQAHFTKLIQHEFRHPGFKSRAEVDALIRPEAVLFHSNKDGSLIRMLRGDTVESESAPGSTSHSISWPDTVGRLINGDGGGEVVEVLTSERKQSEECADLNPPIDIHSARFPKQNLTRSSEKEIESVLIGSMGTTIQVPPMDFSAPKITRSSMIRDAVGILKQLGDNPSRKALVQRELRKQRVMR